MNAVVTAVFWGAITLGVYAGARALHARRPRWWTSPMLATWTLCGGLIVALHTTYQDYLSGTQWLIFLLGPATVAFAIPIHRHRTLIRRHRVMLGVGVVTGCLLAIGSSWLLAGLFHLSPELRASLLPRSITTPFAMSTSSVLGGLPELTASFTAITGLFGAAIGELLLTYLPVRSAFARGALFGMGAHGAGVAKAREIGGEEGAVAGLIMVLAGLFTVIGVAVFSAWL
ncbi:MAG: LrgB family protein [Opitutaceae bacterium]|jgi:putative effector of murein hydrolase